MNQTSHEDTLMRALGTLPPVVAEPQRAADLDLRRFGANDPRARLDLDRGALEDAHHAGELGAALPRHVLADVAGDLVRCLI